MQFKKFSLQKNTFKNRFFQKPFLAEITGSSDPDVFMKPINDNLQTPFIYFKLAKRVQINTVELF